MPVRFVRVSLLCFLIHFFFWVKNIYIYNVYRCAKCVRVCVCVIILLLRLQLRLVTLLFFIRIFFVAAAARTRHRLDVKICQKTAQNLRSFWFVCVHVVYVCACERASKLMLVAVVVVVVVVLID